jgi:hypothetical protein
MMQIQTVKEAERNCLPTGSISRVTGIRWNRLFEAEIQLDRSAGAK